MSAEEIREWIQFAFIVIGGFIALRTYIISQRQRRLENSIKLIEIFEGNLHDNDISGWERIFVNSSEPSGAKKGHFYSKESHQLPFNSLFIEGPDDDGSVERIIERINLISYEILQGTIDVRVIYSRIGQLINTTYSWFGENESLIAEHYPYFNKVMSKYSSKFKGWPTKTYSHCE